MSNDKSDKPVSRAESHGKFTFPARRDVQYTLARAASANCESSSP